MSGGPCARTSTSRAISGDRDLVSRDSLVVALYQKATLEPCSLDGHAALIDHIASGNEEAAAQAMRRHLQDVMASLDLGETAPLARPLRDAFRKDRPE